MHSSGHAVFLEFEPEPDIVKVEPDSAAQEFDDIEPKEDVLKSECVVEKMEEEATKVDAMNECSDQDDADDFFGDAMDEQMTPTVPVTVDKVAKKSVPKEKRKKIAGAYKRKYDRRFHHNYSEYQ